MRYDEKQKKRYKQLIESVTGFKSLAWYRKVHLPRVLKNKDRYKRIAEKLNLPLALIPCIETKEYGSRVGKFDRYLGNGQPLNRKTTIVPKNRGPFKTWEGGVEDAIKLHDLDKIDNWTEERFLFECEKYNGFGYYYRDKPSAYVWSFTLPHGKKTGLFVSDGKYNPNAESNSIGVYAMYKLLVEADKDFSLGKIVVEKTEETKPSFFESLIKLIKELLSFVLENYGETKAEELKSSKEDRLVENTGLPRKGMRLMISFLNDSRVKNKDHAVFINMGERSSKKRLHIIDLKTNTLVESHKVAHGKNSDPDGDGYVDSYSNTPESKKSSRGALVTSEHYGKRNGGWSKFDYATKLDGLEKGVNDNARKRAIVFHSSAYVNDFNNNISGRSWGCPAVDDDVAEKIQSYLKKGTLFYVYDERFS